LNNERAAKDSDVLAYVKDADAIFFAGGDQSKYWKSQRLPLRH